MSVVRAVLTDPVDEHPAAGVVPRGQHRVVGAVEEAQDGRGGQTGADLGTLPPPPLVVQQQLQRNSETFLEISSGPRFVFK